MIERPTVPIRRLAQGGGLFTDGDWIESPFITDEGIRLIQTGNVGLGLYKEQGFRFISEETFHALNCTEVLPGDLLICRLAEPVGRSCIAPSLGTRMITSVDVAILRPRPDSADVRYLNYCLSSSSHLEFIDSIARGGTRQRISRDQLGFAPVPLPPISTQRATADYLDRETARIDTLVERKHELLGTLDERRMTVMADGVSGRFTSERLVPSTLSWLPCRGGTWREAKLTLIAHVGSGHTPSRDHPEWWEECNVPWITTGEVAQLRSDRVEFLSETREKISEIGVANSSAEIHPKDTVVLCRTASAGYSGIMGTPMATSQDFATWTCGPLIRPRFLLLCLRAMRQDLLGRLAMGSTHKTIYMPDIEALRVPLPPVHEQDVIVDSVWFRLQQADAIVDRLHRQIALLLERRQALITAAVTGELEVPGVAA